MKHLLIVGLLLNSQLSYASSEQRCSILTRIFCHGVVAGTGGVIALTGLIMIGQDFAGFTTGEIRHTHYEFNNRSIGIKFVGVGSSIAAYSLQRVYQLENEARAIARQLDQAQPQVIARGNDENV